MKKSPAIWAALVVVCAGCGGPKVSETPEKIKPPTPPAEVQNNPYLNDDTKANIGGILQSNAPESAGKR